MIEVFADVACPFTHVGLRRLAGERMRARRDDLVLHVRSWPLEIVNGAPLDPGFIAEEVDALRRQVTPDLFVGFDPAAFPGSSLPALRLARAAYQRDAEVGEAVSLDLRTRLFELGQDISQPTVLDEVANSHDIDQVDGSDDAVLADYEEGKRRGVIGSPHFFIGDRGYFCPALEIENVDGHLLIRPDVEQFEQFLSDVLTSG
jgi:predicted DsbA family dithiol-disulfide isomerase